jgi:regulatory protein
MASTERPVSRVMKTYSPAEALQKISHYCAYQERSHKEVRNKLYSYGLHKTDVENILTQLITDGFLNEERFAKAFAGGKFRMKKWGRNKIIHELESQGVTPKCIQKGLREIDEGQYRATLEKLIRNKLAQVEDSNLFKIRDKVARFMIGKGYEPELTWMVLKEMTGSVD